jgi:hypothetical protein
MGLADFESQFQNPSMRELTSKSAYYSYTRPYMHFPHVSTVQISVTISCGVMQRTSKGLTVGSAV